MVSITQVAGSQPTEQPVPQPGAIDRCGRCGNRHEAEELDWMKFQRPIVGVVQLGGISGEGQFTHWAMCPDNTEPILFWRGKRQS